MVDTLVELGLWGFFLLAFVERIVPVLPSYVLFPMIGVAAAKASLPIGLVILAASLGSVGSGVVMFLSGRYLADHYIEAIIYRGGPRIGLPADKAEYWISQLRRQGEGAILISQLVPTIRLVSPLLGGLLQLNGRYSALAIWIGSIGWIGLFTLSAHHLTVTYPHEDPMRLAIYLIVGLLVIESSAIGLWWVWKTRIVSGRRAAARRSLGR